MKVSAKLLGLASSLLFSHAAFGLSYKKVIECDSGSTWVDLVQSPTGYEIGRQLVIADPEIVDYLEENKLMQVNEKGEVLFTSKFTDYRTDNVKTGQLSRVSLNRFTNQPQYLDVFMRYDELTGEAYLRFDIFKSKTTRNGVMRGRRLGGWEFNDCHTL